MSLGLHLSFPTVLSKLVRASATELSCDPCLTLWTVADTESILALFSKFAHKSFNLPRRITLSFPVAPHPSTHPVGPVYGCLDITTHSRWRADLLNDPETSIPHLNVETIRYLFQSNEAIRSRGWSEVLVLSVEYFASALRKFDS